MSFLKETGTLTAVFLFTLAVGLPVLTDQRNRLKSAPDNARDPPSLMSFLPFLGRAIEMGKDAIGFIRKYRQKLGNVPIFSAFIAGQQCHFLADPDHVLWSFSHPNLSHIPLHIDFYERATGLRRETAASIYENPALLKDLKNGVSKHVVSRDSLKISVEEAQKVLKEVIESELNYEDWTDVDLMSFCRTAVILASVAPFISEELAVEEVISLLGEFDAGIPLAMAGVPGMFMPKFVAAREKLVERLKNMTKESAWLATRRAAFRTAGFDDDTNARSNLSLLWATNGNSVPIVFWALANVLLNEPAYNAIRTQVDECRSGEVRTLEELEQLTVINSVFSEALRLFFCGFVPRMVTKDTTVETKGNGSAGGTTRWNLRKGTRVMTFPPVLHHDDTIFHDADKFVHDRFVPGEDGRPPEFRTPQGKKAVVSAFGGGAHLCPGRKFIMYEFHAMVATIFENFDMRAAPDQQLPPVDISMEGIGVSQPAQPFRIQVRRRKL